MLNRKIAEIIAWFSFITMLINGILFGSLSVNFIFLFGNYLVIIIALLLMINVTRKYNKLPEKLFVRKIFFLSLRVRLFSSLFLYILFYYITGTELDVEPLDSLGFHEAGVEVANLFRNNDFSFMELIVLSAGFDYIGYTSFLGIVYFFTNDSVIVVRIIQIFIGSYSVLQIYYIGRMVWNEHIGKNSAIIAMAFQPLIMYDSMHLRETFMVLTFLLFIRYTFVTINYGITLKRIIILLSVLIALTILRTALFVVALLSLITYLLLYSKAKIYRKAIISLFIVFAFYLLVNNVSQFTLVEQKMLGYAGMETEVKGGGRSLEQFSDNNQTYASILSVPLLAIQSLSTPYPSMVKTNIALYNQTLQWYYIGGLMIYGYLIFFGYLGVYKFYKDRVKRKKNSLILISLAYNILALVTSAYIFSIRFNIIKMAIAILFIGYGLSYYNKKMKPAFIIYCIFISVIIIAWNYVKLAGRGLY